MYHFSKMEEGRSWQLLLRNLICIPNTTMKQMLRINKIIKYIEGNGTVSSRLFFIKNRANQQT